jgi:hypothetical protein
MDSKWFEEDRAIARKDKSQDFAKLKAESEKALKNSTLFARRLNKMVDDMIAASERDDEDFSKPNWELQNVANASRRKTLREIKKLIQL